MAGSFLCGIAGSMNRLCSQEDCIEIPRYCRFCALAAEIHRIGAEPVRRILLSAQAVNPYRVAFLGLQKESSEGSRPDNHGLARTQDQGKIGFGVCRFPQLSVIQFKVILIAGPRPQFGQHRDNWLHILHLDAFFFTFEGQLLAIEANCVIGPPGHCVSAARRRRRRRRVRGRSLRNSCRLCHGHSPGSVNAASPQLGFMVVTREPRASIRYRGTELDRILDSWAGAAAEKTLSISRHSGMTVLGRIGLAL